MNGILEQNIQERLAAIPARSVQLEGHLVVPEGAQGIVLFAQIPSEKRLEIVPGATHLFEEPGALEAVAKLASEWFEKYLAPAS